MIERAGVDESEFHDFPLCPFNIDAGIQFGERLHFLEGVMKLGLPRAKGLFVTGTDTGVGKTIVAGGIARILAEGGKKVGVFKPVATGCRREREGLISDDAEFLAYCSDTDLPLSIINPVGYVTPAAPLVSAAAEKRPVDFEAICSAYKHVCQTGEIVIAEGIGGVRVPITADFDVLDLAVETALAVLIVARPALGTINHTLMTVDCVRGRGLDIAGVVINGYNATEATVAENTAAEVIAQCGDVDVLVMLPFDEQCSVERCILGEALMECLCDYDWRGLIENRCRL
ncbi:MAG: dethiobiotin synthase [Planctomycetota bacterium]